MAQVKCSCGRSFLTGCEIFRKCHKCRKELSKAGICVACGENPAILDNSTCEVCYPKIQIYSNENEKQREERPEFTPSYRGVDHREVTHETKFGKWHG